MAERTGNFADDRAQTGSVEKSGTHEKRADEISGVSVTVCQGFIFAVKII